MLIQTELGVLKKFGYSVSPTNILFKGGELHWDKVDCAMGYKVLLNEVENIAQNLNALEAFETVKRVIQNNSPHINLLRIALKQVQFCTKVAEHF